jgi:BASS family bile acid:Na+ symporter
MYKLFLALAAVSLAIGITLVGSDHTQQAGPFLIAFFVCMAIGFRAYPALKGFSYTVTIFAAVTTALFYPGYFQTWNGFKLPTLITPLLQIIMFGMGTSMSFGDFAGVVKCQRVYSLVYSTWRSCLCWDFTLRSAFQ